MPKQLKPKSAVVRLCVCVHANIFIVTLTDKCDEKSGLVGEKNLSSKPDDSVCGRRQRIEICNANHRHLRAHV